MLHAAAQQSTDIACPPWAHSNKPAAAGLLLLWAHGATDRQTKNRQTETIPFHKHSSTNYADCQNWAEEYPLLNSHGYYVTS